MPKPKTLVKEAKSKKNAKHKSVSGLYLLYIFLTLRREHAWIPFWHRVSYLGTISRDTESLILVFIPQIHMDR
jgi:hypothetical protein